MFLKAIKFNFYNSLLFFLPFFSDAATSDSGTIINLHPKVGNMITVDEKIKYRLFPEYRDSLFSTAQLILNNDSTYTLVFKTVKGDEIRRNATTDELDDIYYAIDRKENHEKYISEEEKERRRIEQRNRNAENAEWAFFFFRMAVFVLAIVSRH